MTRKEKAALVERHGDVPYWDSAELYEEEHTDGVVEQGAKKAALLLRRILRWVLFAVRPGPASAF